MKLSSIKVFERAALLDKRRCYALRGVCMLMIVMGHVSISGVKGADASFWQTLGLPVWGTLGTGVFLFLSGYGLSLSMQRAQPLGGRYLRRKLLKLFEPFLLMWGLYMVCFLLFDRERLTASLLTDFLTLSFPSGIDAWFFKVILCLYILCFFLFKSPMRAGWRVAVMFGLAMAYYFVCRRAGVGPWWYSTILNFPVGMLLAWLKDRVPERTIAVSMGMAAVLLLAIARLSTLAFAPNLCFSFLALLLVVFVRLDGVWGLRFVGLNSLFYYFLESPVLDYLPLLLSSGFLVFSIVALAAISLLTWAYGRLKCK